MGVVILISIAIAAGVVFLLVLLGILWTLFSRKEEQIKTVDQDEDDDSMHQRPSSLLAHVNAATRTTILGATSPFSQYNPEKEEESTGQRSGGDNVDVFGPDASNYVRAETPSDAIGVGGEVGRPAHARYSFEASGEGELALTAGMELEILDDSDQAYVLRFSLARSVVTDFPPVGGLFETRGQTKRELYLRHICTNFTCPTHSPPVSSFVRCVFLALSFSLPRSYLSHCSLLLVNTPFPPLPHSSPLIRDLLSPRYQSLVYIHIVIGFRHHIIQFYVECGN